MFAVEIIAVAMMVILTSIYPAGWLVKRKRFKAAFVFFGIGLIASIYTALVGIFVLVGWGDPFANADLETLDITIGIWPYL